MSKNKKELEQENAELKARLEALENQEKDLDNNDSDPPEDTPETDPITEPVTNPDEQPEEEPVNGVSFEMPEDKEEFVLRCVEELGDNYTQEDYHRCRDRITKELGCPMTVTQRLILLANSIIKSLKELANLVSK